jgi:hypothetical protein
MTDPDCQTCNRLSRYHRDCESTIQKLKLLARAARASSDTELLQNVTETLQLMEIEAADLVRALEKHRRSDHATPDAANA